MLIPKSFFYLLVIVRSIFFSNACSSQALVGVNDSTGLHSYSTTRGDTIVIGYDSAFVLNKKTFKLYHDNYQKVKNGNTTTTSLIENYEKLITFQDSMMKSKEAYYQGLKSNFDSLVNHSNNFVDKTAANINSIEQSLATATAQLNEIKV